MPSHPEMNRRPAFLFGLLAGIATIGYYLVFYAIDKRLFFHLGVYWSSLLIFIGLMLAAVLQERRQAPGEYTWQQALRVSFAVFVVATAVFQLFYYLFFNFGDPNLVVVQQEVLLENLERYGAQLGEGNAEKLERGLTAKNLRYGPGAALQTFARSAIGGFILSLAMAFITRKE